MIQVERCYWQIYEPDGGGGEICGPRAASSEAGIAIAKFIEKPWGRCRISKVVDSFMIFETLDEYVMHKSEERIKMTALAKLTEEEKRVLGL